MTKYRITPNEKILNHVVSFDVKTIEQLEKKLGEFCDDEQEIIEATSWAEMGVFGNVYDGYYFEIEILPRYEY
jgi:hypothetical protein